MELKTLALGAVVGMSMTTSALSPVMAQTAATRSHPLVTPIFCDLCDELKASGGYSRFTSGPGGYQISFGMADILCYRTYVGARIDASKYPANSWSIKLTSQGGEPFFMTQLLTSSGVVFTPQLYSYTNTNGQIQATFDGPAEGYGGDKFVSIFVYDNGESYGSSFRDTIDLSHGGIRVDGVLPWPNVHQIGVGDCTGIFGNGNV